MFFHRCTIHVHLHHCQSKAVRCAMQGCKAFYRRRDHEVHLIEAAQSHQVLQDAEIQRLRRLIVDKVESGCQKFICVNGTSIFITLITISENGQRDLLQGRGKGGLVQVGHSTIQRSCWAADDDRQRRLCVERSPVEGNNN